MEEKYIDIGFHKSQLMEMYTHRNINLVHFG